MSNFVNPVSRDEHKTWSQFSDSQRLLLKKKARKLSDGCLRNCSLDSAPGGVLNSGNQAGERIFPCQLTRTRYSSLTFIHGCLHTNMSTMEERRQSEPNQCSLCDILYSPCLWSLSKAAGSILPN